MVYDLIRTLLVTLGVGFVPGYFWSRSLVATGGLTARFAYCVAFSMTPVPEGVIIFDPEAPATGKTGN